MVKVQMSTSEAVRLLAQAIINITEGHETIKKDSPIYHAMLNIVDIEKAGIYLEHGPKVEDLLKRIEEGWQYSSCDTWNRDELCRLNVKLSGQ